MSEKLSYEKSCGAVVFCQKGEDIKYLLACEHGGYWVFPKGHMESNETEIETARREILEETGLNPDFLPGFKAEDEYNLAEKPGTRKRVTYFLAEYKNQLV